MLVDVVYVPDVVYAPDDPDVPYVPDVAEYVPAGHKAAVQKEEPGKTMGILLRAY